MVWEEIIRLLITYPGADRLGRMWLREGWARRRSRMGLIAADDTGRMGEYRKGRIVSRYTLSDDARGEDAHRFEAGVRMRYYSWR